MTPFPPPHPTFSISRRPKLNLQPLYFTIETFGKKLAKSKIVARVNLKKIKAKKIYIKLGFVIACDEATKICQ
jgi:hypothetical protein